MTYEILISIGQTLDFIGKLLVSYTAISVHQRVWKEHKIDEAVFSEMKRERILGFAGVGGLGTVYLLVLKALGQSIGGRPLLIISTLMVVVGIQSVMMGMLGELMMRTYFESSGRKTYLIREKT